MDITRSQYNEPTTTKKGKGKNLQLQGRSHTGSRSNPCAGNSGSTIINKNGSTTTCP